MYTQTTADTRALESSKTYCMASAQCPVAPKFPRDSRATMAFAAHSSGASRTVVLKSLISNAWTATAPHFPRRGIFGVRLAEERAPRRWGGFLGKGTAPGRPHAARPSL